MFIPKTILSSPTILSPIAISTHQNFAKKYSTISKKHKPQITEEEYDNSFTEIPSLQLQKDIFNWFFSLDIHSRLKVSTIYNKWNTNILSQLLMIYSYKTHLIVRLADKSNNEYYDSSYCTSQAYASLNQHFYDSKDMECFVHYYRLFEPQSSNLQDEDNEGNAIKDLGNINSSDCINYEQAFIQMIKFISLIETNDALCLHQSFLEQDDNVRNCFMTISRNKAFTSWIDLTQEDNMKMYNFSQQEWIKKGKGFSVPQIVFSYYEHVILLNYQYYYYTKKLYDFPYHIKLTEIIDLNAKLEIFFEKEKIDNVLESIDLDDITAKIKIDNAIKKEVSKHQKNQEAFYNLFFDSRAFFSRDSISKEIVYDVFKELRKIKREKSVKALIDKISFIEPKSLVNFDVYIYKEIYEYIHNYYVEKNLDDLLTDTTLSSTSGVNKENGKSKKKGNRKKKKNKDSNSNNSNVNDKNGLKSNTVIESKVVVNNSNSNKRGGGNDKESIETLPMSNLNGNKEEKEIKDKGKEDIKEEGNCKGDGTSNGEDNANSSNTGNSKSENKKRKNKGNKNEFFLYPLKTTKQKHKSSNDCFNAKDKETNNNNNNNNTQPNNKTSNKELSIRSTINTNKIEVQSDSLSIINQSSNKSTTPSISSSNITIQKSQEEVKKQQQEQLTQTQTENSKDKDILYPSFNPNTINNNNKLNHIYNPVLNNYYPIPPYLSSKYSSIFSLNQLYYTHNPTLNNLNHSSQHQSQSQSPNQNQLINFNTLSNEIYSFNQTITKNIEILKPYKDKYRLKIEGIIKQTLETKYHYRIAYFGSYVSNLALENSDIDVLIIFKAKSNDHTSIESIINELVVAFKDNRELFNYINPIYTASIPLIKLQCDFNKDIDKEMIQSIENDYLFDKSELCTVKFDLSFKEENDVMLIIPSQNVLDYIRESLMIYPDIKPLISVIKRFMQKEELNSSFKGGLSSFSLFLMVLSFFKLMKKSIRSNGNCNDFSIGQLLFCFFEFYGMMDYNQYIIDSKRDNPYVFVNEYDAEGQCAITILDPITGLNVAKTSFRIDEIKNAFIKGSDYLRQGSYISFGHNNSNGSLLTRLFYS